MGHRGGRSAAWAWLVALIVGVCVGPAASAAQAAPAYVDQGAVDLGPPLAVSPATGGTVVAVDPSTSTLYAAQALYPYHRDVPPSATVLRSSSPAGPGPTVELPSGPNAIAVDPVDHTVYLSFEDATVRAYRDGRPTGLELRVPGAAELALDVGSRDLLVLARPSGARPELVRIREGVVAARLPLDLEAAGAITVDPGTHTTWILSDQEAIAVRGDRVVAHIDVGATPGASAIDVVRHELYITLPGAGSVVVRKSTDGSFVRRIDGIGRSRAITVDPSTAPRSRRCRTATPSSSCAAAPSRPRPASRSASTATGTPGCSRSTRPRTTCS